MRPLLTLTLLLLPFLADAQDMANDSVDRSRSTLELTQAQQENPRLTDDLFVKKCGQANLAEIQFSRLAVEKATRPEIEEFAQKMIKDHAKANAQLKQIAKQVDVEVPEEMEIESQIAMSKLDSLAQEAFDDAYIEQMVDDHKTTLALFEKAANSDDLTPQLQQFAGELLPTLRDHSRIVQKL